MGADADDARLERAAWAMWRIDAAQSPRVDPRAVWRRVRAHYRRRAAAAIAAYEGRNEDPDVASSIDEPPRVVNDAKPGPLTLDLGGA